MLPFSSELSKALSQKLLPIHRICHFHLKWLESKPMQEGANMAGAPSTHKKGLVVVEGGEAFPRGGAEAREDAHGAGREHFLAGGDLERCSQATSMAPVQ